MIVVTGAAGFIGSNIVADLEERGKGPVAVVDRFGEDERWRNLARRRVEAFVLPEHLDAWLDDNGRDVTAVVHMGAISATTERDVDRLVANNINFTVRLWDWCAGRGVPFVYASSAATYGGIETGFVDDDDVEAMAALEPLNAYGWSKKATDILLCRRVADGKPAPPQWAGLKFFNVYGPNEYHKGDMMSVACKMFDQVRRDGRVTLFRSHRDGIADGDQRRDFVYVKDCTRTVAWLLDHPACSGIFNVGSGQARSFLDIARAMGRAVNVAVDVEFVDMPPAIRDRYQYFTQADMTKLRAAGMDATFTTLEEGISDYAGSYLARADRYR
ncbi:ADP-glyceromanno-heptose 6-epimerase [Sphingomonas bacterium]|uniref:ADP-glyceromanno-heptose 6-epimerase n=1 Tax=Sphingomonas bacterium TaxID=1895847 RepID=UPI0015752494|nr:ADP-glyceromanno-heptose 6-epimerase [Sphingomonas bacterium]